MSHLILIVDDEPNYLVVLSELLADEGFEVLTATNGLEGMKVVEENDIDVVVTDMQMPKMDGLEFLQAVKKVNNALPVIMITAHAAVEKAVVAMQSGAYNYLAKPFSNDELIVNLHKAIQYYSLIKENLRLRKEMRRQEGFGGMVGKNKKMQQVYRLIEKVAPTESSVLISGEVGTGRHLAARAIHSYSRREQEPFLTVQCGALDERMLEQELFGREGGVDEPGMRKGVFELAGEGTVFIGEVGELSLSLQTRLIRVLQDGIIERIGGNVAIPVNARIIGSTSKDLKEEVEQGRFREDLYFKLKIINIPIPPLRERSDDILLLIDYFAKLFASKMNKKSIAVSSDARKLLSSLSWNGNIMEFENTMERAAILCTDNIINADDIQPEYTDIEAKTEWGASLSLEKFIPENASLKEVLYAVEENMLNNALDESGFVQSRAAKKLGITKSLLQYKMKKYKISKKS